MQNLIFLQERINETQATEAIMQACHANPERDTKFGAINDDWVKVTFSLNIDSSHEACIRLSDGVVVALANVDEFDC